MVNISYMSVPTTTLSPNPWARILDALEKKINRHSYDTWLKPTRYSHSSGGILFVRVPTVEEEDARRSHRERQRLIRERTAHINRIKGLLFGQGIRGVEPRLRRSRIDFSDLRTGEGLPLPARLRAELEREYARLDLVETQLRVTEAERDTADAQDPSIVSGTWTPLI